MFTIMRPDSPAEGGLHAEQPKNLAYTVAHPTAHDLASPPVPPSGADHLPTVLSPGNVIRLGLQNDVARRLRVGGCRVLSRSRLDDRRLSIQIMPPPTWHRLNLSPTRIRSGGEPSRCEASLDGVRIWWLADDGAQALRILEDAYAA